MSRFSAAWWITTAITLVWRLPSTFQALRRAYSVDVGPILAMVRHEAGGAIDPLALYRTTGWRERKAQERRPAGAGAGIV